MNWIKIEDQEPPKNEPFLAYTNYGIEKMQWNERAHLKNGWYGFSCACACCDGYCSDSFNYWMPLPDKPKD